MLSKEKIKELEVLAGQPMPEDYKDFNEDHFKTLMAGIMLKADKGAINSGGCTIAENFSIGIDLELWEIAKKGVVCLYIIKNLFKYIEIALEENNLDSGDRVNQLATFILKKVGTQLQK